MKHLPDLGKSPQWPPLQRESVTKLHSSQPPSVTSLRQLQSQVLLPYVHHPHAPTHCALDPKTDVPTRHKDLTGPPKPLKRPQITVPKGERAREPRFPTKTATSLRRQSVTSLRQTCFCPTLNASLAYGKGVTGLRYPCYWTSKNPISRHNWSLPPYTPPVSSQPQQFEPTASSRPGHAKTNDQEHSGGERRARIVKSDQNW